MPIILTFEISMLKTEIPDVHVSAARWISKLKHVDFLFCVSFMCYAVYFRNCVKNMCATTNDPTVDETFYRH
jgi:hypothetical protein